MASIYATGSKGHHKFTLTVTETGTSKADNASTIAFSLVMSPVITGYGFKLWGSTLTYKVVIDGSIYTGNLPDYGGSGTVTVRSGTQTITHDADGTKTVDYSFIITDDAKKWDNDTNSWYYPHYTPGNASAEGSVALTRILRNPPTLTASVEDSNPATLALTGDAGKLVRYFSNAAFALEAEAHDGATVESRTVTCGGKSLSGENGVFEKVESGSFVFTATDSYGNSGSEKVELSMVPYIPLTCDLAPTRPDAEGNMTVSVSGNCFSGSFGVKENALKVFYRYRETGDQFGNWVEMTVQQTENSYLASGELTGLDHRKAYVFQAKAEDILDTVETAEYTAKAIPVFDWGEEDFNINGTLKMSGVPVADFIVEQGTDGIWRYRKWNSGMMECWANGATTLNIKGQIGGFFFGYGEIAFSSGFIEEPTVNYTVSATNGYDFCGKAMFEEGKLRFYVGSTVDLTKFSEATFRIYAIGKWKKEDL